MDPHDHHTRYLFSGRSSEGVEIVALCNYFNLRGGPPREQITVSCPLLGLDLQFPKFFLKVLDVGMDRWNLASVGPWDHYEEDFALALKYAESRDREMSRQHGGGLRPDVPHLYRNQQAVSQRQAVWADQATWHGQITGWSPPGGKNLFGDTRLCEPLPERGLPPMTVSLVATGMLRTGTGDKLVQVVYETGSLHGSTPCTGSLHGSTPCTLPEIFDVSEPEPREGDVEEDHQGRRLVGGAKIKISKYQYAPADSPGTPSKNSGDMTVADAMTRSSYAAGGPSLSFTDQVVLEGESLATKLDVYDGGGVDNNAVMVKLRDPDIVRVFMVGVPDNGIAIERWLAHHEADFLPRLGQPNIGVEIFKSINQYGELIQFDSQILMLFGIHNGREAHQVGTSETSAESFGEKQARLWHRMSPSNFTGNQVQYLQLCGPRRVAVFRGGVYVNTKNSFRHDHVCLYYVFVQHFHAHCIPTCKPPPPY